MEQMEGVVAVCGGSVGDEGSLWRQEQSVK